VIDDALIDLAEAKKKTRRKKSNFSPNPKSAHWPQHRTV